MASHEEIRRSSREKRSRFMTIQGQQVLKLNNYTMEEGEGSVFNSELLRGDDQEMQRMIKVKPPKNAFQIFMAERSKNGPNEMKMASAEWKTIDQTPFRHRAEKLKQAYDVAYAKAFEDARRELAERRALQQAQREAQKREEEKAKLELAERRERFMAQHKAPKTQTVRAPQQKTPRQKENAALMKAIREQHEKQLVFFSQHEDVVDPFVPPAVLRKLRAAAAASSPGSTSSLPPTPSDCKACTQRQPPSVVGGQMRGYQLQGLQWLTEMYEKGGNPILADEMGLGKTLQTVAFLAELTVERKLAGPHLVVVPLSVISNWMAEFRRWCPSLRVLRLHTQDAVERQRLRKCLTGEVDTWDVVLTTYETVKGEFGYLLQSQMVWRTVVLDEGHKVKNYASQVSQAVHHLRAVCHVLITGTPLQNNLSELWALLVYLYPAVFPDSAPFDDAFELNATQQQIANRQEALKEKGQGEEGKEGKEEEGKSGNIIVDRKCLEQAHYLMRPLMLRRLKTDVEQKLPFRLETKLMCPLTGLQKHWYRALLLKEATLLTRAEGGTDDEAPVAMPTSGDWKKLQSLTAQLRKVCNHPFMFDEAEAAVTGNVGGGCDDSIVQTSGKMKMLDRLLPRLQAGGHRVVLFSQFTHFLDIIDDYLRMRGYAFVRLDGSTSRVQRMVDIQEFNKKGSRYFCYIMSTRAGGLGINAQSADTVILMDSDWNPQVDLQAMARVHRIGQTKVVHVYRLVSSGTMEERIVQRAQKKLFLDAMVNRGSTAQAEELDKLGAKELLKLLSFGFDSVFDKSDGKDDEIDLTAEDVDAIIDRTRTGEAAVASKALKSATKESAANFNEKQAFVPLRKWNNVEYKAPQNFKDIANMWVEEMQSKGKSSRARTATTVTIGRDQVLKSTLHASLTAAAKAKAGGKACPASPAASSSSRQVAGRDYDHQSFCLSCWDGGDLLLCDQCPCAYHVKCLGYNKADVSNLGMNWGCPHHSCYTCGKKAAAVGGLLFRCEVCPTAYCEDCLPDFARDNIINQCERFIRLGQRHPSTACFVICCEDCKKWSKGKMVKELSKVELTSSAWDRWGNSSEFRAGAIVTHVTLAMRAKVLPVPLAQLHGSFSSQLHALAPWRLELVYGVLFEDPPPEEITKDVVGKAQVEAARVAYMTSQVLQWRGVGDAVKQRGSVSREEREEKVATIALRILGELSDSQTWRFDDVKLLCTMLGVQQIKPDGTSQAFDRVGKTFGWKRSRVNEVCAMLLAYPHSFVSVVDRANDDMDAVVKKQSCSVWLARRKNARKLMLKRSATLPLSPAAVRPTIKRRRSAGGNNDAASPAPPLKRAATAPVDLTGSSNDETTQQQPSRIGSFMATLREGFDF